MGMSIRHKQVVSQHEGTYDGLPVIVGRTAARLPPPEGLEYHVVLAENNRQNNPATMAHDPAHTPGINVCPKPLLHQK